MSNILAAAGIILSLVLSGYIIQALMKLVGFIVKILLIIASFFKIRINVREKSITMSDDFKRTYKGITRLKLSDKNLKPKASIDWFNLGVVISSVILIIVNLGVVSGNVISKILYNAVAGLNLVPTVQDMNTLFTAVIFSLLSFSASKVLQRWKATKQARLERKHEKLKRKAVDVLSTKDLLEAVNKRDEKKKKELQ